MVPIAIIKAAFNTARRSVGDPANLKNAVSDLIQRRTKRPLELDEIGQIDEVISGQAGRSEQVAPRGEAPQLESMKSKFPEELTREHDLSKDPSMANILSTYGVGTPNPEQLAAARLISNIRRKVNRGQEINDVLIQRAMKADEALGQSVTDPSILKQDMSYLQQEKLGEQRFGKHLLGKGRVVQEETPTGFRSKELTDESQIPGELAEHGFEGSKVSGTFSDVEIPQTAGSQRMIRQTDTGFEPVPLRQGREEQGILLNKLVTMANSGDESAAGVIKQLNEIEAELAKVESPNRDLALQYRDAIFQEIREKIGPPAGGRTQGPGLAPSDAQRSMLQDLPGSEKYGGQVIPEDLPPEDLMAIMQEIARRKGDEGYRPGIQAPEKGPLPPGGIRAGTGAHSTEIHPQSIQGQQELMAKRLAGSPNATTQLPLSDVRRTNPADPFGDTPISSGAFDPSASSRKLGGEVREDITRDMNRGRQGAPSTYGEIGPENIAKAETKGYAVADKEVEGMARSAMVAENSLTQARQAGNRGAMKEAEIQRSVVIQNIQKSRYGNEYTTSEGKKKAAEEFQMWAAMGRQISEGTDPAQLPPVVQELRKNAVIAARQKGGRAETDLLYNRSGKEFSQVEKSQELLDQGKEYTGSARIRPQTAENQSEIERVYDAYKTGSPAPPETTIAGPESLGRKPAQVKTTTPGEQIHTGDELVDIEQGERIAAGLNQGNTRARGGVTDVTEGLDDGRQATKDAWPEGFGEPSKYDPTNPLTRSQAGREYTEQIYPLGKQIEALRGDIKKRTDPVLGARIDELTEQINDIEARKSQALTSGRKISKDRLDNFDKQISRTVKQIQRIAGRSEAPMGPAEKKQIQNKITLIETYIKRQDRALQGKLKEGNFAQKPKKLPSDHEKKVSEFKTRAKKGQIIKPGTIENIITKNPERYEGMTDTQKRQLRSRFTSGKAEHSEKLILVGKNPFAKKMKEDLKKSGGIVERYKAPFDKAKVEAKKKARVEKKEIGQKKEMAWSKYSEGKTTGDLSKELGPDMTVDQVAAYNSLKKYGQDKIRSKQRRMGFLKDVFENKQGASSVEKATRKVTSTKMKQDEISSISEQVRSLDKRAAKSTGGDRKRLEAKKAKLSEKIPEGSDYHKARIARKASKTEDMSETKKKLSSFNKELKEKEDNLMRNEKRMKNPAFAKGIDPTKKRYSENLKKEIEKIKNKKAELRKLYGI